MLLFNLGGPGSESTRTLPAFHARLSRWAPELVARFDLVAFDPRGIGRSTPPLRYLEDGTLERMRALELTPDDEAERLLHDRLADEVLASAQELDARYAARVDTASVARDVDLLRAALGEETISYYGGSYGALLGALYTTLFPARARSFVLDSPVMPVVDRRKLMRAQTASYERAYLAFISWCDETDACALHDLGADGLTQALDSLLEEADETPIVVEDRTLSGSDILTALAQGLGSGKNAWPGMAEGLEVLLDGGGESVLASADGWYGRTPASFAYEMRDALGNGSSVLTYDDSSHGQFLASTCVRDAAVAFLLEPGATEDASCAFERAASSR